MKRSSSIIIIALMICICISFQQKAFAQYKIVNKFAVEGDAGWDYLTAQPSTGRLFISHGNMVQVMNTKTGKITGSIKNLQGVHGIALAEDINRGYITNGRDSSVTVFNLKTLEVITKVSVTGKSPDAILYDQFSHQVFSFNARTNNATVINANDNKVTATIPFISNPEFAVSNGKGKIYVNLEDTGMIAVINTSTLKVENLFSLAPGEGPSGLAIDLANNILFSVCDNKLMVILDAATGKIITTVPIGERVDGAAFDPKLNRAYSSNGDGTLTVVQEKDATHFKVIENVTTQKGARTISVDTNTHHLYLPTAEYGEAAAATTENPHPRPPIKPGTFVIVDVMPGN